MSLDPAALAIEAIEKGLVRPPDLLPDGQLNEDASRVIYQFLFDRLITEPMRTIPTPDRLRELVSEIL